MKVNITKESLGYLTVLEHEKAKQIVKDMKSDGMTVEEYATQAVHAWLEVLRRDDNISDGFQSVLSASAHICKDSGSWNVFDENSGRLDIWIDCIAETSDGFLKLGCLLSDIWALCYDDFESYRHLVNSSYDRYFTRHEF